ncbi:MAG: phosphatase PAP2 family protein [Actinomycetota bacterium]
MPHETEHVPPPSESRPSGELSARAGARGVLAATSLALIAIPFSLLLLLVQARWAPLLKVDRGTGDTLHRYAVAHGGFVAVMQLISNFGSSVFWVVALTPVVAWLLWRRLPRMALFVVVTMAGSSLLNAVVKSSVHRLRPALSDPVARAQGLSFPSAHAQAAMAGYAVLLLVFLPVLHGAWRRTGATLAVLAVLAIGFSRIALGVHYVSDVVAGIVLGAAWFAAMAAAFNVMGADRERRAHVTAPRSDSSQGLGGKAGV